MVATSPEARGASAASRASDAAQLVSLLEPFGPEWLQLVAPHVRELAAALADALGRRDAALSHLLGTDANTEMLLLASLISSY